MDSLIRADLSQRALLRPGDTPWVDSPSLGVTRRPLDRMGDKKARATSLVRYAAGSAFPEHPHPEGEEIFVMDGVFSDESGDHPAGSYLRNPPGSAHSPHSKPGCLLFVKLRQFDPADRETVRIETHKAEFHPGQVPGLTVFPLHSFGGVSSALVQWAPGTRFLPHTHWGGEEILVLQGTFQDEHGDYPAGTWMRSPHLSRHHPFSTDGCLIYVKVGHLG